ncbi:hypothetical protein Plim_1308 [Planctopirus limnophila DSM 3776]|uniref:Uncharacterized protein n=1 Tax=Planctopirus limnophila (strain ATCC 43296 / DSM 3776 / IFAM 1008 / Mu 290) TaxID=521674 RepID=D5SUU0_PLAL2|nr:hypothetical protein [Planctopirus limnophila]ADG67142.1 hypothetical protein Plim_1308 [Planctopirus limnophila DSM 3776]
MPIRSDQPWNEIPQPKGNDHWHARSFTQNILPKNVHSSGDREEAFDLERQEFFSAMDQFAVRPVSMLPAFRLIRHLTFQEPLSLQLEAGRALLAQWTKREGWCRELLNAARHSIHKYVQVASEIVLEWISSPAIPKGRLPLLMLNRLHADVGLQNCFQQDQDAVHIILAALQCGQLLCELSKREIQLTRRDQYQLALALLVCDWSLLAVHFQHQKIQPSQWPAYQHQHGQISAAMMMSVESVTPRLRSWVSQHGVDDAVPADHELTLDRHRNRVTRETHRTYAGLTIAPGMEHLMAVLKVCQLVNSISDQGKENHPWRAGIRHVWKDALRGKLSKDLIRTFAQSLAPEELGELRTVSFEGRRYRVDQGQTAAALLNGPHWLNRKQLRRRHAGLHAMRKWKQNITASVEADAS